jgi:hypothetical protein
MRAGWTSYAVIAVVALIIVGGGTMALLVYNSHGFDYRSFNSSSIRQIGQGSLIYASEHQDRFPQTDSVYEYAAELARYGGLNDTTQWIVILDSSESAERRSPTQVLTPDRTAIDPAFLRTQLDITVVARGLHANLPATTPIAWTRGLQPDGTWSKDSPYGGDGGHIVFLGGNVQFYRNLSASPLARFDDPKATTTDIRKALPPDAFIAEPVLR